MNNKRKLRITGNIHREAARLLKESENFLVTKRGYDYACEGKEISEEKLKSLISDLTEQREILKKDANRWVAQMNQAIKELENHVRK